MLMLMYPQWKCLKEGAQGKEKEPEGKEKEPEGKEPEGDEKKTEGQVKEPDGKEKEPDVDADVIGLPPCPPP